MRIVSSRVCIRGADVQNSTVVFQLNFSNDIGFCASILSRTQSPRRLGIIARAQTKQLQNRI